MIRLNKLPLKCVRIKLLVDIIFCNEFISNIHFKTIFINININIILKRKRNWTGGEGDTCRLGGDLVNPDPVRKKHAANKE